MDYAATAVFVHGIFSGPDAWGPLIELLRADKVIGAGTDLRCFEYSSPKAGINPLQAIPTIEDAAIKLRSWLRTEQVAPRLALIGHSQGGLVIQNYLKLVLEEGKADELRRVRAVALIATPNNGSELFLSLRRGLGWIWHHAQERQLRPHDERNEQIRKVVFERAVYAAAPDQRACPIRFFVCAGESDGIVPVRSARSIFPGAEIVPGDHHSILKPDGPDDQRYRFVRSALRYARNAFPADGLLVQTGAIDLDEQQQLTAVLGLLAARFLPSQGIRKEDLRHWLQNYQEKWELRLSVLLAMVNGRVLAFTMFHEGDRLIVVDYIAAATEPDVPAGLLVRRMIAQLTERSVSLGGAPIVFEVEDPDAPGVDRGEAKARIRLFNRLGARVIEGVSYLAPNMETMEEGDETRYRLMYARAGLMPQALDKKEVDRILRLLYQVWYRNWFSHLPNAHKHETYLKSLYEKVRESIEPVCPLT